MQHESNPSAGVAPAVARVGVTTRLDVRRLAEIDLPEGEREALCQKLAPELDHLIAAAEERGWAL
jgi:hypothetical protein